MKITKSHLRKIIKEELESFSESEGGSKVSKVSKVYLVMRDEYEGQTMVGSRPVEAYLSEQTANLRADELNANEEDPEEYGYEVEDYPLLD